METLFTKSVPAGVREFIALRSGNVLESSKGKRKQKESEKSVDGNLVTEQSRN